MVARHSTEVADPMHGSAMILDFVVARPEAAFKPPSGWRKIIRVKMRERHGWPTTETPSTNRDIKVTEFLFFFSVLRLTLDVRNAGLSG